MLMINLGSGHGRMDGYTNVDGDPLTEPDILSDLRHIPLEDGVADEVYASHVLEHFWPNETFSVLMEWKRLLKPGGVITIKVPDVGSAMRGWVDGSIGDCCLMKAVFGSDPQATALMPHKNLFWTKKLSRFLFITGFVDIEDETVGQGELVFKGVKPHVTSRATPGLRGHLVRETSRNGASKDE